MLMDLKNISCEGYELGGLQGQKPRIHLSPLFFLEKARQNFFLFCPEALLFLPRFLGPRHKLVTKKERQKYL